MVGSSDEAAIRMSKTRARTGVGEEAQVGNTT